MSEIGIDAREYEILVGYFLDISSSCVYFSGSHILGRCIMTSWRYDLIF